MHTKIFFDQPGSYRIRVHGRLGEKWADYFDHMAITVTGQADGSFETELVGELLDQGAVQGVLQKLYNLGFPLISVERILSPSGHSTIWQERPPPG